MTIGVRGYDAGSENKNEKKRRACWAVTDVTFAPSTG